MQNLNFAIGLAPALGTHHTTVIWIAGMTLWISIKEIMEIPSMKQCYVSTYPIKQKLM